MIAVHAAGDYAHRQPLAYPAIRALLGGRVRVVDRPGAADLVVVAHPKDLRAHGPALAERLGADQRLALLSEEPLWDTVWGEDPTRPRQSVTGPSGVPHAVAVLNHHGSAIYDFDHIPYFLLTSRSYVARYAAWFARNAGLDRAAWRARLDAAAWDVAFLAEYRDGPEFDIRYEAAGIFGLGAERTRIALACNRGRVLRSGAGWNTLPRRQSLPDWHLEKYLDLSGRVRILSAIENTHQKNYVSEKLFDAYAAGAVPLYVAGPGHRVRDVAPEAAFLNLYGLDPDAAAARIGDFAVTDGFLDAYRATQDALAARFNDPALLAAEQARLANALVAALETCLG